MSSYTPEQYRKDKKKLIGAGMLIMAGIVFLLHNWNMGRLDEIRAERIRAELEREMATNEAERPAVPAFGDIFDLEKMISPEIIDKVIEGIGEDNVQYREENFENFKITISSEWQEFERESLEVVLPGISYEIGKAAGEILFLAHNFDIRSIIINMLRGGDINIGLNMPQIDSRQLVAQLERQETLILGIVEFKKLKKTDNFIEMMNQFDKESDDFKIIDKNIIEKKENEIRIKTKFSLSQEIDGGTEEVQVYSYKKIVLINEKAYAFVFLGDSELTEKNREKIDKILKSVTIN